MLPVESSSNDHLQETYTTKKIGRLGETVQHVDQKCYQRTFESGYLIATEIESFGRGAIVSSWCPTARDLSKIVINVQRVLFIILFLVWP